MCRSEINVLFLFPSSTKSTVTYNLDIGYLSAYIHEKGFASSIFLSEETDLRSRIQGILSHKPRIIAFSVSNNNYVNCLLIARRLKQVGPYIIVVFGGPTPTVNHQFILENNKHIERARMFRMHTNSARHEVEVLFSRSAACG